MLGGRVRTVEEEGDLRRWVVVNHLQATIHEDLLLVDHLGADGVGRVGAGLLAAVAVGAARSGVVCLARGVHAECRVVRIPDIDDRPNRVREVVVVVCGQHGG